MAHARQTIQLLTQQTGQSRHIHRLMRMMTAQLDLFETMSPGEYQQIRLQLGDGSGQDSPGFKFLLHMPPDRDQSPAISRPAASRGGRPPASRR